MRGARFELSDYFGRTYLRPDDASTDLAYRALDDLASALKYYDREVYADALEHRPAEVQRRLAQLKPRRAPSTVGRTRRKAPARPLKAQRAKVGG